MSGVFGGFRGVGGFSGVLPGFVLKLFQIGLGRFCRVWWGVGRFGVFGLFFFFGGGGPKGATGASSGLFSLFRVFFGALKATLLSDCLCVVKDAGLLHELLLMNRVQVLFILALRVFGFGFWV